MKIEIEKIKFVEDSYPRNGFDPEVVGQYALNIDALPPITINKNFVLVDGYHRLLAYRNEGRKEIETNIINIPDDRILFEATKLNSLHGRQLTIKEKRHLALIFIRQNIAQEEIGNLLAINQGTVSKWLTSEMDEMVKARNERIFDLWLACHTQKNIADKIGLSQPQIAEIIGNMKEHILESPPIPKKIQIYNVWNIPSRDNEYGLDIEGKGPPGQAIENLLYYFTEPFDLVVDPMAGGGSTIDVCKFMKRRFLAHDINPSRDDIKTYDLTKGWPKDAKNCDFIYLDPPYYSKINYGATSVSTESKEVFLKNLTKIAKCCYSGLSRGGRLALAVADFLDYGDYSGLSAVLAYEYASIFQRAGFLPEIHISCPVPSEQWSGADVDRAKEKKIMLETARDIFIFFKPKTKRRPAYKRT